MSVRKTIAALIVVGMVASIGCRKPAKLILTKDQRIRIQENILKEAPKTGHEVGALFGENIRLLGVDLSSDNVNAGETMTVTYYWECLKETPGEWKVFVHLELPGGKRMILDHHPMGELYPIRLWKKGEIVKDVQRFTIAADMKSGSATLWTGLYNEAIYREQGGGDRMKIENKDEVSNDGSDRVRAVRFQVRGKGSIKAAAKPVLKALKAKGGLNVDGVLDEPDWDAALPSKAMQSASGGRADPEANTAVMAVYDDKALYIAFHVTDNAIENPRKDRDDELWKGDVVEVYLDAGSDGKDYLELQVSPANVVFDALFKSHRNPDWKVAREYTLKGLQTAVVVDGTLNKAGDKDTAYVVEMAIPFAAIPGFSGETPKPGTSFKANFFRIEARDGKVVSAQAFSPAGGDFHDLDKAGTMVFVGDSASLVRKVSTAAAGIKADGNEQGGKLKLKVNPSLLKAAPRQAINPKIGARPVKGKAGEAQ